MSPYIALQPFTDFEPQELGRRLSHIVGDSQNQKLLAVDFPGLQERYAQPEGAIKRVAEVQKEMRAGTQFVAMAVILGTTKQNAQVEGVTTFTQHDVPRQPGMAGTNLAVWLNPQRPDELRGIGPLLMHHRLQWLLESWFTGHIWTVIRPGNKGSLPVWRRTYSNIEFVNNPKPRRYPEIDSSFARRLLFTSIKPLEALRLS